MMNYRIESFDIKAEFLRDLVVFDLETTGLDPISNEIIEIAAVRIKRGKLVPDECFHSLVKPKRKISWRITEITGITDETVKDAPSASLALKDFCKFCGDSLLIAHNGHRFDMKFLEAACRRGRRGSREVDYLDSLHLSKILWGKGRVKSHSLDSVISRLRVKRGKLRRHSAHGDAHLTAQSVVRLLSRIHKTKKDCEIVVYTGKIPI